MCGHSDSVEMCRYHGALEMCGHNDASEMCRHGGALEMFGHSNAVGFRLRIGAVRSLR